MSKFSNKKILIVEDDKDFLWIFRESFNNQNLSVVYAMDGLEGLAMAEKEKPDLIVLDIMLPKMNGIDVARELKRKGIKSQIIFLTNMKDSEHISQAIDVVGETDYIVKADMHIDAIVERIKEKLGVK
ncbi:MAG: hypothetical protein A3A98_01295 [Candidatus Staskawiczbacteria bacterium RIFCSPLOWO2_01_FULL_40_39]|uniref:Response regulatory domain-containing protein n=1 Tax=Candidatus Staskawiczbacteria bacterium RIFCSPHIGHO2_01_FULL_39_25 TaxID=1802202 RepID=A0A1G2HN97_9BACT|nr:MAG: hypothetical protein A2730_01295 [Candidatus Staskawiczbacteria bacterium RIFCSPHIGHO2_01_FULL_39_25]OGZ73363.1 MAG: hypothetical protein A3A98_01295 [Candidatus Staskawiczbacteria bacterium RIFCSPLOWO2_01_FULL_40_39]OGZ75973.1 MAG: hypothetical protein A3I87_02425 [Candidatus Staskawiczbacteria bacterium RIFCSPLOWO2_02_FULL_39_8]